MRKSPVVHWDAGPRGSTQFDRPGRAIHSEAANGANRMRILGAAFPLIAHGGFSQGFGEGGFQPTTTPL